MGERNRARMPVPLLRAGFLVRFCDEAQRGMMGMAENHHSLAGISGKVPGV